MIKHGYCPENMLSGTTVPIPKVKGNNSADNYRAITLSNVTVKLMEAIILRKTKNLLNTSNLQYGFKSNMSTTSCTFVVQEVISYYNDHDTPVICTLLDASNSFDWLHFCILFKKLIKKGLPTILIRFLLHIYKNQTLCVQWNGSKSDDFVVTNGVKQGGIISPVLFCVYIDDLLVELSQCGGGCKIGPYFYGCMGYADDIILLNPTVQSTNTMLQICEKYASEHRIVFNASKSQVTVFSPHKCFIVNVRLDDNSLENVTKVKHLGHVLDVNSKGYVDISYIKGLFVRSVNMLLADFGNIASKTLINLFRSYCTSLYGIILCNISCKQFSEFEILWRKCVRRIMKLHPRTHNDIVHLLSNNLPLYHLTLSWIMSFYWKSLHSSNISCQYLTVSNMGINYRKICNTLYVHFNKMINVKSLNNIISQCTRNIRDQWLSEISNETKVKYETCLELLEARDDFIHINLNKDEIAVLHYVCINWSSTSCGTICYHVNIPCINLFLFFFCLVILLYFCVYIYI